MHLTKIDQILKETQPWQRNKVKGSTVGGGGTVHGF